MKNPKPNSIFANKSNLFLLLKIKYDKGFEIDFRIIVNDKITNDSNKIESQLLKIKLKKNSPMKKKHITCTIDNTKDNFI